MYPFQCVARRGGDPPSEARVTAREAIDPRALAQVPWTVAVSMGGDHCVVEAPAGSREAVRAPK
eukprot:145126-Alexandrium_andersonii.AAC.1